MEKVKVNLISGNVVEKPIITSFRNANGEYVILDNESNGSMGLPIICIAKYNGEELQKIYDPSEWNAVKETLKSIIAGNSADYININKELRANDDFFTQLSLPVASFDTLKNQYIPKHAEGSVVTEEVKSVEENPEPKVEEPQIVDASMPMPEMTPVDLPTPEVNPVSDVNIPAPEVNIPSPEVSMPASENNVASPELPQDDEIAKIKESYLKACENMFDALLNKLKK